MALEAPGLAKLIPHGPSLPCRVSSWATSAAAPASGTGTLVLNSFDLPARKRRRLAFAAWGPRVTTRAALAKRGPSTGLKSPTKAAAALPAEGAAGAARAPCRRGLCCGRGVDGGRGEEGGANKKKRNGLKKLKWSGKTSEEASCHTTARLCTR